MEQKDIQNLFEAEAFEELIELLENSEYEEFSMITLCKAYLCIGEEKNAKKIIRKYKLLFPAGVYTKDGEKLYEIIEEGKGKQYLEKLHEENKISKFHNDNNNWDSIVEKKIGSEKKVRIIPQSIKEYFIGVIGLENVQVELDKFYKLLRFQNERKEKYFINDLIRSSHFVISGMRGCGKTLVGEIIAGLLYDFEIHANRKPVYMDAQDILLAYRNDIVNGIKDLISRVEDSTIIFENIQCWFRDGHEDAQMLASLEKALKDESVNSSVILTGTVDSISKMKFLNETLEDAFYTFIEILPYSTVQLLEITKKIAKEKALLIHKDTELAIIKKIDMEKNSSDFMNGITIKRYLDDAAIKMAERYYENNLESEADMVYLMAEDFKVEMDEESLDELLMQLDSLTGLSAVKEQIRKRIQTVQAEEMAQYVGAERKKGHGSLHMMFVGNPGTGKTTVARLVGKIYQQLGILPRGNHLVECTRSNLVGQYVGETAKLVQEKVKDAIGGVLFIDEAYALCRDEHDSFGQEAVDELIPAIENNKDNMLVILAGYKNEMGEFLKTNSGFSSRIRNTIEFEDYTIEEMVEIFNQMVKEKKMKLEPDAEQMLYQMLEVKSKIPDFGNARGVRNLLEEVMEVMNARLIEEGMLASKDDYDTIRIEDIQNVAGRKSDNEKTLDELLDELNALTGLQSVKDKVQEMVDNILVKEYIKEHSLGETAGHGTLHLVFKGNAGTGKTTVARILGKIYKKLGVLSKDVFVECGRKDLVANYSGQTATRVIKKIEEANGGILFIDEAYTLNGGEHDEFGKEAINTLVAELENRRDNLMVIVAGYAEEMERFLDVNQGLASRLSNEIIFEDYSQEEMLDIFKYMVNKKGLILPSNVDKLIMELIQREKEAQKDFGNARGIRNIIEGIEKKKNSRIATIIRSGVKVDSNVIKQLQLEDFA